MEETIRICKHFINTNNLKDLQGYVLTLLEYNYDWPYLFQKVYLHACLKGDENAAVWLQNTMYPIMDPIQQIAVRHVFPYGRHLMAKAQKI